TDDFARWTDITVPAEHRALLDGDASRHLRWQHAVAIARALRAGVDQRRERHGRSGMTRVRLLNRIDRECADRIHRELIELVVREGTRFSFLSRRIHRLGLRALLEMTSELAAHGGEQLVGEIRVALRA